jgi:hypothetical protein
MIQRIQGIQGIQGIGVIYQCQNLQSHHPLALEVSRPLGSPIFGPNGSPRKSTVLQISGFDQQETIPFNQFQPILGSIAAGVVLWVYRYTMVYHGPHVYIPPLSRNDTPMPHAGLPMPSAPSSKSAMSCGEERRGKMQTTQSCCPTQKG